MRSCPSAHGLSTRKSTAFSPVSSKYGSQSLLHDHMMSHYRRIQNAKSAIDNKPPKSREMYIANKLKSRSKSKDKYGWDDSMWNGTQLSRPSSSMSAYRQSALSMTPRSMHLTEESHRLGMNDTRDTYRPQSARRSYADDCDARPRSVPMLQLGSDGDGSRPTTALHLENNFPTQFSNLRGTDALYDSSTMRSPRYLNGTRGENNFNDPRPLSSLTTENYDMYPEFQVLKKKKNNLEEEQMYLDFMNGITDEVIKRGIFSNRVLMHVCRGHVERRKKDLDEGRMWEMINKLREDLNVKDNDD